MSTNYANFCGECGTKRVNNCKFCINCGESLNISVIGTIASIASLTPSLSSKSCKCGKSIPDGVAVDTCPDCFVYNTGKKYIRTVKRCSCGEIPESGTNKIFCNGCDTNIWIHDDCPNHSKYEEKAQVANYRTVCFACAKCKDKEVTLRESQKIEVSAISARVNDNEFYRHDGKGLRGMDLPCTYCHVTIRTDDNCWKLNTINRHNKFDHKHM